jgi:hypothetical protein
MNDIWLLDPKDRAELTESQRKLKVHLKQSCPMVSFALNLHSAIHCHCHNKITLIEAIFVCCAVRYFGIPISIAICCSVARTGLRGWGAPRPNSTMQIPGGPLVNPLRTRGGPHFSTLG